MLYSCPARNCKIFRPGQALPLGMVPGLLIKSWALLHLCARDSNSAIPGVYGAVAAHSLSIRSELIVCLHSLACTRLGEARSSILRGSSYFFSFILLVGSEDLVIHRSIVHALCLPLVIVPSWRPNGAVAANPATTRLKRCAKIAQHSIK
jgi:hypothetical protein